MINLNSVTMRGKKYDVYVLPGGRTTTSAFKALDVLMEIRNLTERTIEAQKARKSVMKTKSGAIVTRKQSGNSRYFLGV